MKTIFKDEKKAREDILRNLIFNEHNLKGVSYKFFVDLLNYYPANFSMFMKGSDGISIKRIEILEKYFEIKIETIKKKTLKNIGL